MRFRFIARLLPPVVEPRRVWSVTFSMVHLKRDEMPLMLVRDVQTGVMTPHFGTTVEFNEPREVEAVLYAAGPDDVMLSKGPIVSRLVGLVDAQTASEMPNNYPPVSAEAFDEATARYRRPRG